ncbi:alpha-2-antiplasmin isoform X2 [Sphaerodactylus townsendi]|uniref:alpha-2-antiplasmin isoform X2 n=1 Tax=Sphaerodactylus townsendi TaxID=933632 RepID=UPI00202766F1|nr:alpha-2-antiplasmin isoform X2 [Sphaerodactylus townsendi]
MAALLCTRLLLCLAALLHSRPTGLFACASDPANSAQDEAVMEENVQPEADSAPMSPSVPSSVAEIQEGPPSATLLLSSPPALEAGIPDQQEEQENPSVGLEEEAGRSCEEDLSLEKMHTIAEAMLKFTVDLVREVELQEGHENLFLSPLSITLALAHLALGAANQTEKAILEALHLAEMPCLHQALRQVHRQLDQSTLNIAARLYLSKGFQVKETFLEDSEKYYKAKAATLSGKGEEDLAAINSWVKEATKGHISEILSEPPGDVAMILLNAVHFQGFWRMKFDPELTEPGVFQLDNEFVVSAEMMKASKYPLSWYFLESLDAQVAKFPFKGNMSFVAIVPNRFERNISQMLTKLRPASILGRFPKEKATMVKMPKVHLKNHLELNQAISQLGLGELFSSPDLRNIADGPLFVSSIEHSSALDIAEAGVEASAVTSVVMLRSFSSFVIDRPFFFFILEDETGIPLFFGHILNPSPGAPKQKKEPEDLFGKGHLDLNIIPK